MRDLMKADNGIKTGDALPSSYGIMKNFEIQEKSHGGQT
jgi:hypothetical protein